MLWPAATGRSSWVLTNQRRSPVAVPRPGTDTRPWPAGHPPTTHPDQV